MIRFRGLSKLISINLVRLCSVGVRPHPTSPLTESQEDVNEEQTNNINKRQIFRPSARYLKFKKKLLSEEPTTWLPETMPHPAHEKEPLMPWPNSTNPHTGEIGGPRGPEPTRYGDWESRGRVTDF